MSKKDNTKDFIIQTSYSLFAKNGFTKITMKDVCEATKLSRGGLYSHFSSTKELFEALLEQLNQKEEMNFFEEIKQNIPATKILEKALTLMEDEMNHPEDSLSLALYEYADGSQTNRMNTFIEIGEKKWTALVEYGITTGEFNNVDVAEIVNIILYAYQGIRMWSRITAISPQTMKSIISHIKKQLIKPPLYRKQLES